VLQLLVFKCDLLLKENKLAEADQAIVQLGKLLPGHDIPRYFEGRALLARRKWVDAVKVFEQARIGLSKPEGVTAFYPMILPDLEQFRGVAYQQLGQTDLAIDAFRASLSLSPDQPQIAEVLRRLEQSRGRTPGAQQTTSPMELVAEMLSRPEAEQQWSQIEEVIRADIESKGLDEAAANMYWAEYRFRRKQTDQAYQLMQEALATDPPQNVLLAAIRLSAFLPEAGPEVSQQLIDQCAEKFGDNATLRLERGRMWIVNKEEGLVEKLWSLDAGSDQWDEHQRTYFFKTLAEFFRQIGQPREADKALERVAAISPQDVEALMEMFAIARDRRDNAAMEEVQRRIVEVVGSEKDNRWQYTEAARLITLYASGMTDPQLLKRALDLTDTIEKQRPQWHELYRLRGDIFTLQGRIKDAIAAYDRAMSLGPPNALAVRQHVQLLVMQDRFQDARRVVEALPEQSRLVALGTLYPEILLQTTDPNNRSAREGAFDVAAQVVEQDPDNAAKQLWYAEQLLRHGRVAEAEAPVRKAVELNPLDQQTWVSLVRYLAIGARRPEDAEQALREARLALPEHETPLLLAQGFALLGRWWQAEREYLIAHKAEPDDLNRIRLLADYYLGPFYPEQREDRYAKAVPYLNALLKKGETGGVDAESVRWARRKASDILARTGDYQKALQAERLLQANEVNGQMLPEDKLQLARILAGRPEPVSRQRAIALLEGVQSERVLDKESALLLAQLYWKIDQPNEARQQIFDVVAWYGDEARVWQTFVAMLLARGNFQDAARYFEEKLEPALPNPLQLSHLDRSTPSGLDNLRTLELGVQVWNKQGQREKALAKLYGTIPRKIEDLREEDVPQLLSIGGLLILIDEPEKADPVFKMYAAKRPNEGLVYVKFLGAYLDVEKAFEYLVKMEAGTQAGQMFPVVQTALAIVNARRDEVGESKDELVQRWLDKALRENPDSTQLLGLKADLLEMQGKYQEAQATYERILALPGFTGLLRSRVLNNLAYLLALQNIDTARALKLVEEARAIRGPSDDILDTEAVVQMVLGNYTAAIENLKLAVTEDPNAEKWFHLARAYHLAGNRAEAREAWGRAKDFEIGPEKLNRMEHQALADFSKEMEQQQPRTGARPPT
jgi:tetratricopeptide (TPR) repeat protein